MDFVELEEFIVGNKTKTYLFNVVDNFSKYAWSFITDNRKAETVETSLLNCF